VEWQTSHNRKLSGPRQAEIMACGGGTEQLEDEPVTIH
jgi:anaerobic magnesium-protoporphyrin IX monomethyl ester cyclase